MLYALVVETVLEGRVVQIRFHLSIILIEDRHAPIRQVLQRFEQRVKTLGEALCFCRIHHRLQRLQDLNLLVTSLAITFDRIKDKKRCFTEGIEGDALKDGALLLAKAIFKTLAGS